MQDTINAIAKPLGNSIVFFVLYFLSVLPTYFLPYLGSNSSVVNAAGAVAGIGLSPQFWAHVGFLLVIVVLTWLRGCATDKQWITVFPAIAGMFDMTPGLSLIPFVPTVMHVVALVMGVRGSGKAPIEFRVPVPGAALAALAGGLVVAGLIHSMTWQSRVMPQQVAVKRDPQVPRVAVAPPRPSPNTKGAQVKAVNLSGSWSGETTSGSARFIYEWEVSQSKDSVQGTIKISDLQRASFLRYKFEGNVSGGRLTFRGTQKLDEMNSQFCMASGVVQSLDESGTLTLRGEWGGLEAPGGCPMGGRGGIVLRRS